MTKKSAQRRPFIDSEAIQGIIFAPQYFSPGSILLAFFVNDDGNVAPRFTLFGSQTNLQDASVGDLCFGEPASPSELYVSLSNNQILVFNWFPNGNTMPGRIISGQKTLLSAPGYVAVSKDSFLYVANVLPDAPAWITVYKPGAAGDAMPAYTLTNPGPVGLNPASSGIGLNSRGELHVLQASTPPRILVYSAKAMGNDAPARVIDLSSIPLASLFYELVLDGEDNIYVGFLGPGGVTEPPRILVLPPNASGPAMPIRTIVPIQVVDSYSSEFGLALDWYGYVYLRGNQGISVFPPSASGDTAPVRTIIGSNTGLNDVIRTPLAIQSNPPE